MIRRSLVSDAVSVALLIGALECSPAQQRGASDARVGPANPSNTQPVPLGGTSWRLVKFQGNDGTTLEPDDRDKYTVTFATDGRLSARVNCNRGMGSWKSRGSRLELGPLALTRAMCLPEPIHDQLVKQWAYLRSYEIRDGHLFLTLVPNDGAYEFEPIKAEIGGIGGSGMLRGSATYRERIALPPGAVLEATLEEVSRADAPGRVIGRTRVDRLRNPPIRFTIPYEPSRIDPRRRYLVRAQILVDDKPFFVTDQKYPVLSGDQGKEVALMLRRSSASDGINLDLENTYWKLTELNSRPVGGTQTQPHLVLDPTTRRVTGSAGCNRLSGGYQVNGDELKLNQTVSTLMACAKGMETEKAFLDAIGKVSRWRVSGQQLELLDSSGNVLARFEGRRAFE